MWRMELSLELLEPLNTPNNVACSVPSVFCLQSRNRNAEWTVCGWLSCARTCTCVGRTKEGSQTNKSNSWDNNNINIDIKLIFVKSDGFFCIICLWKFVLYFSTKKKWKQKPHEQVSVWICSFFMTLNFTHYVTQLRTQPVLRSAWQDFILRSYFNVLTSSDCDLNVRRQLGW